MALFGGNDQDLTVTIKAKDEASAQFKKVNDSVTTMAKGFAVGTVAVDAIRAGFRFLSGTINESIALHERHMQAQARMIHIFRQATNATDGQIRALLQQADALEKVGVVSEEAILAAQGTLATFDLQADSVRRLIPAFLDMVVAERGINATTEDMIGLANGLGKVLQGQVGALSKQGFIFNEAQEQMLKYGTETQKVDALVQILSGTYGGLNEAQRQNAGSALALQQRIEDLKKGIGSGVVPALNNMFSALENATSSMGKNVQVGRVVYKTLALIGEFAANTAAGIHFLAGEVVTLGSYFVQVGSVVGVVTKSGREGFENFREAVEEGVSTTVDFALELRERNRQVENSWDSLTDGVTAFSKAGIDGFRATGLEAQRTNEKIKETQRALLGARTELENFQRAMLSDDQAAARAFVDQERKVSDLRKAIAGEDDPGRRAELNAELGRESIALEKARPKLANLSPLIMDERRRASLTDFERSLEDIGTRKLERMERDLPQMILNFNFNDAVAGDEGIQRIIMQTIRSLDRKSALILAGQ